MTLPMSIPPFPLLVVGTNPDLDPVLFPSLLGQLLVSDQRDLLFLINRSNNRIISRCISDSRFICINSCC